MLRFIAIVVGIIFAARALAPRGRTTEAEWRPLPAGRTGEDLVGQELRAGR